MLELRSVRHFFLEDEILLADTELGPQFQSQKLFLRTYRKKLGILRTNTQLQQDKWNFSIY